MRDHKYRIGQVVNVISAPRNGASSVREYKILRLRRAGNECAYHVKTITEASARFVREDELALNATVAKFARLAETRSCMKDWGIGEKHTPSHRKEERDEPW